MNTTNKHINAKKETVSGKIEKIEIKRIDYRIAKCRNVFNHIR